MTASEPLRLYQGYPQRGSRSAGGSRTSLVRLAQNGPQKYVQVFDMRKRLTMNGVREFFAEERGLVSNWNWRTVVGWTEVWSRKMRQKCFISFMCFRCTDGFLKRRFRRSSSRTPLIYTNFSVPIPNILFTFLTFTRPMRDKVGILIVTALYSSFKLFILQMLPPSPFYNIHIWGP